MTALSRPTQILLNVAFAAFCCGLAARGGIILAMAPKLGSATAEKTSTTPPVSKHATTQRTLPHFDALATWVDETINPLDAAAAAAAEADAAKGSGPLIPLPDVDVVAITWFDVDDLSLCSLVLKGEHSVHSINTCREDSRAPCNAVAEGYRVVRILRDRVFLLHESSQKEQELTLYETKKKAPEVATEEKSDKPAEDAKGKGSALSQLIDGVKQTGPNHFEAPPGMRDNVLGRLNEVAMEGRWLPYFENGKIAGFKLAQTVPNSAFDKIGLKAGDVIKSVNGYDISSPDKMLDVFTKLKDARDINVDLMRGGNKKTSLQYTIN